MVQILHQEPHGLSPAEIHDQAEKFAHCYALDTQRVRAVFDRLMESAWPTEPSEGPAYIVDEAVLHLGPTSALEVFEHEDLQQLFMRVYLFHYLCRRRTPLYTLSELAERTATFIQHLESHRDHLVSTGYPQTNFPQSSWHDWLLGELHPVKFPAEVCTNPSLQEHLEASKRGERSRDERGLLLLPCTFTYAWAQELPPYKGQSVTLCSYEEAAVINGIDHFDATWIEGLRSTVFDLRLRILQRLLQAVRDQQVAGLWQDSLQILTDSLPADDARFLLILERDMCEAHSKFGLPIDKLFQDAYSMTDYTSGLNNLLTAIGHYEKEITIGTLHKTRECLTGPTIRLRSYYGAIGQPWRRTVDTALDCYMTLEMTETDCFWPEFRMRVNHALDTEFYDEVIVRAKIKRPFVRQFKSLVQGYADLTNQRMFLQGAPPPPLPSQAKKIPPVETNEFRKEGDVWKITYKGQTVRLRYSNGLHYIAYLLQKPGGIMDVMTLVHAVAGREADPRAQSDYDRHKAELAPPNQHLSASRDAGEILDLQAIQAYRSRLEDLKDALEESQRCNDGRTAEIEAEMDILANQLSGAVNPSGRGRKFVDPNEKARKSISKAIYRSYEQIAKHLPDLEKHLKKNLRIGTSLSYQPESPLHWLVSL